MINHYGLEAHVYQRMRALQRDVEEARLIVGSRRAVEPDGDQIERPAEAQYGARMLRFRSLPAWSRGSSATKSTERGRL